MIRSKGKVTQRKGQIRALKKANYLDFRAAGRGPGAAWRSAPLFRIAGNTRTLYLGSFYRPPDKIDNEYLVEFNSSLSRIMSNRNAHVLVGGDFNCGDIERSHLQVPHGVQKKTVSAATFGYYRRALSNSSCKHTNPQ